MGDELADLHFAFREKIVIPNQQEVRPVAWENCWLVGVASFRLLQPDFQVVDRQELSYGLCRPSQWFRLSLYENFICNALDAATAEPCNYGPYIDKGSIPVYVRLVLRVEV